LCALGVALYSNYRVDHLPAAAGYRERTANKGAVGRQVVDWQHAVDRTWASLRFGDLRVEANAGHHVFEV
jgi:starch phosphorylase